MRMLGDFVDKLGESLSASSELGRPSRIGVIATAGDRRDDDIRELGEVAAQHFDVVIAREDARLRGRKRGEAAALIEAGVRAAMEGGARCRRVDVVLDELEAVRFALERSNQGDLVVLCVDQHQSVLAALESVSHLAQAGARSGDEGGDPDFVQPDDEITDEPPRELA
jgi:cyanophycin synthetase